MGQCISGPKPRRPDPVGDIQRTNWDSLQPFNQVDLKLSGAILPLPATEPTLEVAVDEGYGTLDTVRGTTSSASKKPVKRVTFNPQVQVQEFERETHERIRLIIVPDSESEPVKRVTFNPQVQVQEFERETHERIRLIIVPDSESDSLESPVPPRVSRVARRKPRQNVVKFSWEDVEF